MKLLRLMWKNAARNRRRTALTILSIMISIFLVSTLQAILTRLEHIREGSDSSNVRLIVHRATSMAQPLPVAYKRRIAALAGVKYVGSTTWFGGFYIDERNFFANFAVDTDDFEKIYDEILGFARPARRLEERAQLRPGGTQTCGDLRLEAE